MECSSISFLRQLRASTNAARLERLGAGLHHHPSSHRRRLSDQNRYSRQEHTGGVLRSRDDRSAQKKFIKNSSFAAGSSRQAIKASERARWSAEFELAWDGIWILTGSVELG